MGSQVRERLSEDHDAVAEVLAQVLTALENKDVQASYARLDLLWARLAVHIRAEHLHLFPAIAPRVAGAQPAIDRLRADHDFFMRELAQSIAILRELPPQITAGDDAKLTGVAAAVREVENRLATHNELEENQIYRWSSTILTEPEQIDLLARVNAELEHRPPRFSADAWVNRK